MKVRFESHWVGKMDGGGRREGKAGAAAGESAKHQHLPSLCLSPPVLPQSVCVLPDHRQCPLPWTPTFFFFFFFCREGAELQGERPRTQSREGQGVRYQVSPAGGKRDRPRRRKQKQKQKEKEAAERPRVTGGRKGCSCRGIWTQPGTVRTWRDRRARSPGHRAPSARAVRSLKAQACPDANQHE